jgi:hypothetical protein
MGMKRPEDRASRPLAGLVAVLALALFVAIGFWPLEPAAPSTRDLRERGAARRRDLERLELLLETLPAASDPRRVEIMTFAADFMRGTLLAACRADEEAVYPAADRAAGGREPFTASARHDHAAMARRIEELACTADADLFRQQGRVLVALFRAHAEMEEEVLWRMLDRRVTRPLPAPSP